MGSEMCIRDSGKSVGGAAVGSAGGALVGVAGSFAPPGSRGTNTSCLLYTSDAADERSSVDLGGRRIIKKNTKRHNSDSEWTVEYLGST